MLHFLRILLQVREPRRSERGASAVEYGLLIAGIAALIVVVVFLFGGVVLTHLFQSTCDTMGQNIPNGSC